MKADRDRVWAVYEHDYDCSGPIIREPVFYSRVDAEFEAQRMRFFDYSGNPLSWPWGVQDFYVEELEIL